MQTYDKNDLKRILRCLTEKYGVMVSEDFMTKLLSLVQSETSDSEYRSVTAIETQNMAAIFIPDEIAAKPKRPAMSDADFLKLCETGTASEVEEALQNGANINAKDYDSSTPLQAAVLHEKADAAEVLLEQRQFRQYASACSGRNRTCRRCRNTFETWRIRKR